MSWHMVQLGELIDIKHGFAFKSQYFSSEGKYILLTPGNCHETGGLKLKGDKEKYYTGEVPVGYVLSIGDLLVVMTDLVNTAPILGGAFIIPEDDRFLHNQRLGLVSLKDTSRINKSFLYYLLNTQNYRGQVRGSASGATVRHTSPDRIKRCTVQIPKRIDEQVSIASILSAYDDLIENNRRRIQLLEQAARLLYKEWFVHLRFPGHEHTTIKNGLPEGWEKKPLGEIADITMGQSPKSIYYNQDKNGLPFHQGVTNFGVRFPSHKTYCTVKNRIAEPGDILFSVRAPVGRINITTDKIVIGRGLAAIRSNCGHQNLLFYMLKSHFFKEDMMGGGAIFAAITKKDLHEVKILLPSESVAKMFMEHVSPIDLQIKNLELQNISLMKARDLLLPRLMNGELAV